MPVPQPPSPALPAELIPANAADFGLLPGDAFRLANGADSDPLAPAPVHWLFRDERIALPLPGHPLAGFARTRRVYDDIADWHAATPIGSTLDAPPLVWTAADCCVGGARLAADAASLETGGSTIPLRLVPRHPLNRSYFDASSAAFFGERTIRVRGDWQDGALTVRTIWPEDFALPPEPALMPIAADPQALRELVRSAPRGCALAPFSVTTLWRRADIPPHAAGQPVLAFILNGAQGDDDEAHGGHFAVLTGRIGRHGAIHDWLVANYYTLDTESEKGIIPAPVPLDNYLADLNAGQAWYRPSYMVLAVLRDARVAAHVQSALGRVYHHFYRHCFRYQHARANCAGISVSTLRALGWQVPERGPESWARAVAGLPLTALGSRSLTQGKATFDYLTEDRTRLYPAVAFEEIGSDLLGLATGTIRRTLGPLERMLAADVDALLFARMPQLPSSRAWGDFPVIDSREYHNRVPKDPAQRRIIPVAPRPFPTDLLDPDTPREPPLRSDYAVAAYAALLALLAFLLAL